METRISIDLIIHNGQVLTMNDQMDVIENGVVVINGKRIIEVGDATLTEKYSAKKIIDAENAIVMPGMVNTHNHVPMIAFRGLGEDGIGDRLMGYLMPLEQELLTRELIYRATVHGAIDMALSGVTTYADMYYHVDEMAKATQEVGLRALLGQTVIGFPVVDAPTPYGGIDYAKNIMQDFKNSELISLALAPHAPYTVSKNKLLEIKKLADENDLMIHIHVAEFENEHKEIGDNRGSLSSIRYLNSIGFLDSNVLIAHCNYADDADLRILKMKGVRIAHNPMANAKGATGTARIMEAREFGIPVGLGTDGPMGSNVVDLFKVMTYTSTIQRIRKMDESIMTPKEVVEMATMGGAKALGMNHNIGSLESGKLADVIVIETKSMNMIPNYDPYATLVFQANPHNVQTTIVNGKIIVENRAILSYDIEKNRSQMQEIQNQVKQLGDQLARKAKQLLQ